ncbi:hypothetical protein MMC27_003995 [Xylographa pallens]|nr:hypothetical protein [Xylographa pallens]
MPAILPLILSSGPTAPEPDSGHSEGIPIIIILLTLFFVIFFFGLSGFVFKRSTGSRPNSSPLTRNKSTTPEHQNIINATKTAISRLGAQSVQNPEAAHIPNGIPTAINGLRPPLSRSMLPAVHLAGENVSMVPKSSPPKYQRHAFRERLPDYESLNPRGPRRERRRSRHGHRTARRSREDRLMRSTLVDPYGISWLIAHSNDEEDGVEGRFSVSAIAPSWITSEEDLEENDEESE